MTTATETKTFEGKGKSELNSIELKRQITVKSIVTDEFRKKAQNEFSEELKLIEAQLQQLESQYQNSMRQLEDLAQQGQNVTKNLGQLNAEVQERRVQLENVKIQVSRNLNNIDKAENGQFVITGTLENYVSVAPGDNIYEKLRGAEIIVRDGVIEEILG